MVPSLPMAGEEVTRPPVLNAHFFTFTDCDWANPNEIQSKDLGPGNCLIDAWVRKNSNKKFDKDGHIASQGKINEIILEQAQELYANRKNKEKTKK